MYLDVNSDGACDARDVLDPSVSSVDVYLTTDHDAAGSAVSCRQEPEHELSLFGYSFILRSWGDGTVTFGRWIPGAAVSGFTADLGTRVWRNDLYVGYSGVSPLPPGTYRLGTLLVNVSGHPRLSIVSSTGMSPGSLTSFGSPCSGAEYDNTISLGRDFVDACGTAATAPVPATTWDVIQSLYR
jgi:hypothetical protein